MGYFGVCARSRDKAWICSRRQKDIEPAFSNNDALSVMPTSFFLRSRVYFSGLL